MHSLEMKATVMSTFALLMLVAVTHGQNLDQLLWQNSALNIDGILADGTFHEVEASSELSCVLTAAHKFKKKSACFRKPRCVIPSENFEKADAASTKWICKETIDCEAPFVEVAGVGCISSNNQKRTFGGALTYCDDKGASLAVVEDSATFDTLRRYLNTGTTDKYYINIRKGADSAWRWEGTGMALAHGFWGDGQPSSSDSRCAVMNIDKDYKLDDRDCFTVRNFICMK